MVTLLIHFVVLLLYIEFSEEVKGYHGVDVYHDC